MEKIYIQQKAYSELEEATKFWSYLWCTITVYDLSYILGLVGSDENETVTLVRRLYTSWN